MEYMIWTLLLCLSVTVVFSQDVTVVGNCSLSSPPEPLTVWGVERDPLTCSLWGTERCSNDELPPQVGGTFMGAPESLKTEGVLIPDPHGNLSPQLIVTWQPPRSAAGFENLKGFYMEFHKLTGTQGADFFCRVFDFSGTNFSSIDYRLKFEKKFVRIPGGAGYLHRLDLYTLPRSPQSKAKKVFFKLQAPIGKNNTADWSTSMSYNGDNLTAPATITVDFSLAPEHYGFTSYFIQLVDQADDRNAFVSCYVEIDRQNGYECQKQNHPKPPEGATTMSHSFVDVPAGTYSVWLQAHDPNYQNDNCLCYHGYHEFNGELKRDCDRCVTTKTGTFVVEGGKIDVSQATSTKRPDVTNEPAGKTSTEDNYDPIGGLPDPQESVAPKRGIDSGVTIAAVLGVGLGLVLVLVVVVVLWKKRTNSGSFPIIGGLLNNNKVLKPLTLRKKTIYLLYTSDHKEHVNAITKFANYLTIHCNCQVFFLPWFRGAIQSMGCYQWVISNIDKSDYVIIINSEAAFNLFDARNSNTSFHIEDQGPEVDMFSMGITHVMTKTGQADFYKKTILTYFEYTNEEFVLKELSPGIQYKLPKHLKELLCHIHEVDTYMLDSRKLEVESMDNLSASIEGRELQEAITKARHFEKSNRGWFQEKFHRQDSAYDSIPADMDNDQENLDSISVSPEVHTGQPPVFDPDHDDEAKSAVTYNTNYINSHPEQMSFITPSDVATTTAPTDYINNQFHHINLHSMQNPVYRSQFPMAGYENQAYNYMGSPIGEHEQFCPPSDTQVEGDINDQFISINMNCFDQDRDMPHHTDQGENRQPVSSSVDAHENAYIQEDLVDGRDV